jgi:enterochelin esterase-like enzyme
LSIVFAARTLCGRLFLTGLPAAGKNLDYHVSMLIHLAAIFLSFLPAAREPEMVQPEQLEQGFVIVVDDIARLATPDRPMYLASNFGGWDPANADFLMTQRSDGRWQIVFDKPERTGTLQFKFALGSWDFAETDPDGNDIDNRTLPKVDRSSLAPGERPVIELSVPRFRSPADISSGRQNTAYRDWDVTGTLRRLEVSGGAGDAAGMMRDLLIWLPPGYDDPGNAERRYPVIYMFDGQNLFEKVGGIPDEWHADETAQRLIESGEVEPFIIVGVPNAGKARVEEYLPFKTRLPIKPSGDAFASWFMATVVPRVERTIRVSDRSEDTAIGGSSLGATIALHIAGKYPDHFGMLLLESSSAFVPEPDNMDLPSSPHWPNRAHIGVGDQELGGGGDRRDDNARIVNWSRELASRLGIDSRPDNIVLLVEAGAEHNELAWSGRLEHAFRSLFGSQSP